MSRLLLLEPAASSSQVAGGGAASPEVRPPGEAASLTSDEKRRLLNGLYLQLERQTYGMAMGPRDERAIRDTEILIEQVKALP